MNRRDLALIILAGVVAVAIIAAVVALAVTGAIEPETAVAALTGPGTVAPSAIGRLTGATSSDTPKGSF